MSRVRPNYEQPTVEKMQVELDELKENLAASEERYRELWNIYNDDGADAIEKMYEDLLSQGIPVHNSILIYANKLRGKANG